MFREVVHVITSRRGEGSWCGHRSGEPVVDYGPFVMNTTREIEQAIPDDRAGRLGAINQT